MPQQNGTSHWQLLTSPRTTAMMESKHTVQLLTILRRIICNWASHGRSWEEQISSKRFYLSHSWPNRFIQETPKGLSVQWSVVCVTAKSWIRKAFVTNFGLNELGRRGWSLTTCCVTLRRSEADSALEGLSHQNWQIKLCKGNMTSRECHCGIQSCKTVAFGPVEYKLLSRSTIVEMLPTAFVGRPRDVEFDDTNGTRGGSHRW